ncbi:MAG: hypothetical protein WCQ82_01785 [Bacteroidaceae bacterium]
MHNSSLTEISNSFCLTGTVASITALGDGLINDTYLVTTQQKTAPNYVLQRINSAIFTNVPLLQYTIEAVTRHIRAKLKAAEETDIDRKVLSLVSTERGDTYYELDGTFWRMMLFIPDTLTYNEVTPSYAEDAGRAFGRFQSQLMDLPETLSETIPNFHNMEFRSACIWTRSYS